ETGEIIESVPDFLLAKYHTTSEYALSVIFSDHLDLVKVLFYMGNADGRLQAEELNILYATIRSLSKGAVLTDKDIDKKLKTFEIPSVQVFKLAFGRIYVKHPQQARKIFLISKKIVITHKKIHTNEKGALVYMAKKLSS
ncbi:hypothetical protein KAI46_00920, partial [bacterium]|nr:hypothetical protein [bacterium]